MDWDCRGPEVNIYTITLPPPMWGWSTYPNNCQAWFQIQNQVCLGSFCTLIITHCSITHVMQPNSSMLTCKSQIFSLPSLYPYCLFSLFYWSSPLWLFCHVCYKGWFTNSSWPPGILERGNHLLETHAMPWAEQANSTQTAIEVMNKGRSLELKGNTITLVPLCFAIFPADFWKSRAN